MKDVKQLDKPVILKMELSETTKEERQQVVHLNEDVTAE